LSVSGPRHEAEPLVGWQRITLSALLLYKFPHVPVGLHRDEMSEAYESYALLHTGADRWGYHLPAYFLSWGSGQNVLQAYLNIPLVAVFGLTPLGARLLPLLLNLACLPFFFLAVRRWYGNRTALLALAFLALSPWHIMLSRWGIENSPLPFFLALGLWTFGRALGTHSPARILPSLLPFALAMYTYGVVIVWAPLFVVLLLLIDLPAVRREVRLWIGALALFAFLTFPIFLFTVKNYVFKRDFAVERFIPFAIPLLPNSRLEEAHSDLQASSLLHHNIKFFAFQMPDNHANFSHLKPWYQLPDVHSTQTIIYLLAAGASLLLLWQSFRARRPTEPFVPWLLATVIIAASVPLNTSRAGVFYLPILALGAHGFIALVDRLHSRIQRQIACAALACFVLVPMAKFVREYYGPVYAAEIATDFTPDMPAALAQAHTLAGSTRAIYVSRWILLGFDDVLFDQRVNPRDYQHSGATWNHPDFGPYLFSWGTLSQSPHPFVFILPVPDPFILCSNAQQVTHYPELQVGVCP